MNEIRQYLVNVAQKITESAPSLPNERDFSEWQGERRLLFNKMLGIDPHIDQPRSPLNVEVTRAYERDGYTVECLSYESLPGLRVEANLYVPTTPGPHPGLLYVCGHSALQKAAHYQQHARRYAQLGFVTLIVDTLQLGDVRGYHHGTHRYGWFHWYSRGYTPAGAETWNGIRGLDLLAARADVDQDRLGVTGTSGGGAMAWWIAAADTRVKVTSPSCGTATLESHLRDRTIDGHCDCMFPVNLYGWSLVDMAALIAPRPTLIVSADRDNLFSIDSIKEFYQCLSQVYEHLTSRPNLELFTFRGPHSYQPASRIKTFQWFLRHLQGKEAPLDQIADVDEHLEDPADLNVYPDGLPANNRSTTVHDWFVPKAEPPAIETPTDLERERTRILHELRESTFSAFPSPLPDAKPNVTREWYQRGGEEHMSFTYSPEEEWELTGTIATPAPGADGGPTLIHLIHPDETRWPGGLTQLKGTPPTWLSGTLATRGTGETAWSAGLQWHLRRSAALTGRTIASMRVLDALQGIKAFRQLPMVDPDQIYLAARGEMAAVALYAALLDEKVSGVVLYAPPATQNVGSNPDGTGECLEMLGSLRITDLPQVAGLLWPAKLVFVGGRPESYGWAEALYERLGAPGGWWNISELAHWRVNPDAPR